MTTLTTVNRTSPYLRAGAELRYDEGFESFLQKSGMDFQVETQPLYDATGKEVPNTRGIAILKEGTPQRFLEGSVKSGFTPVQNTQTMRPLQQLVDAGRATYEAAGTFRGGAVTWALADIGHGADIARLDGSTDPVSMKLFARNAHDGSGSLIWGALPVRFFCTNQLNGIRKGLDFEVRLRHSQIVQAKVEELSGYLTKLMKAFQEGTEVWQRLAVTKFNEQDFEAFARNFLLDLYGDPKTDRQRATRAKEATELMDFFKEGAGNTGESAWDAYNGVSEWIEHRNQEYRNARWTAQQWQRHADSQASGTGRNRRSRALQMLTRW